MPTRFSVFPKSENVFSITYAILTAEKCLQLSNRSLVDRVENLIEDTKHESVEVREVVPGLKYIEGIVKRDDGLILIHDLERFLSLEEERTLNRSMENAAREEHG
jgi:chemotaxis signal transduction protein